MKTRIVLLTVLASFTSCKKTYTCECSNPGGVFERFEIHGTRQNATKTCTAHAGSNEVPWTETACILKE